MEFCQGGSLEGFLKVARIVEDGAGLAIVKGIFQGLAFLEHQGIVHRDIKPANIFMKGNQPIIADFGFAKHHTSNFHDHQIGSPPYMSPQSLTKGLYSKKTDVWAFGVLLFEMFHGEGPFWKSSDMIQLIRNVTKSICMADLRYDLSVEMKQLILGCLEVDDRKRPTFKQISESWYFKKLFQQPNKQNNILAPISIPNNNKPIQPETTTPSKTRLQKSSSQPGVPRTPSFNRLHTLKSLIKQHKDENNQIYTSISPFESWETPGKEVQGVMQQQQKLVISVIKEEQEKETTIDMDKRKLEIKSARAGCKGEGEGQDDVEKDDDAQEFLETIYQWSKNQGVKAAELGRCKSSMNIVQNKKLKHRYQKSMVRDREDKNTQLGEVRKLLHPWNRTFGTQQDENMNEKKLSVYSKERE